MPAERVYLKMVVQVGYGRGPYENLRDYSCVFGVADTPEDRLPEIAADYARTTVRRALDTKEKWSPPMDRYGVLSEALNCPRELVVRIARALGYDSEQIDAS